MNARDLAEITHEINKVFCTYLGDNTQLPWSDTEDDIKNITISGVVHMLENENVTPESSHELWRKNKLAEGWKYGPVKDYDKKEHPCMVDFKHLSLEHQTKDLLFKQLIDSLRKHVTEK